MEVSLHWPLLPIVLYVILFLLFVARKSTRKVIGKLKSDGSLPQPPGAWPFIGHIWHLLSGHGTLARTLGAMADECGPIFSLQLGQRQVVVMSGWEVVKDCFTSNDANIVTRPIMAVSKYLGYNYAAFSISPYGRYWQEMRKISTVELLSNRRLEKMKHVRASEVDSCLKNLYGECTKVQVKGNYAKISLGKWFEYLSVNITLCMIVGKRYPPESYDNNGSLASRFKSAISKATHLAGLPVPSDFVPSIEWMDFLGYIGSMKETHKEIDMIIGHWLDEHIQKREECEEGTSLEECDFMDVLLSHIGEDFFMSTSHSRDTIIKATTLTLLLTGSESISITLTWAISLLLNNPKALKKAQEELDLQVGKERWVQESDITNLPYLQAIVKETLRLYPPSPLTGPREAMKDFHIGGHLIPKGSRILVNIWKLHRDPRVWVRPYEFRPERFLTEKESLDLRGLNFEYIPFSLGRRACPGMAFGLQVVHLMLARMVQGFDLWTENGGQIEMSEGLGLALPKAGPVHAVLGPRLGSNLYEML